jgi:hypothetical protein
MENVSGFSLRRLGVVSALIALVASLLVVPAQQAAFGSTPTLVVEACASSDTPSFNGGNGLTPETAFLISSAGNLETLQECVNNENSTYNASGVHYKQDGNIEWAGDKSPIGQTGDTPFEANYDGGGHTIYGFAQTRDSSDKDRFGGVWAGLFGAGFKCTIENLNVSGSVSVAGKAADMVAYSGILMGESSGCTIRNVSTFGTMTVTGADGSLDQVGGIVGRAIHKIAGDGRSARNTVIENSTSHVDIEVTGARYVGGAVGFLYAENSGSTHTLLNVSASPAEDASNEDLSRGKITVTVSPTEGFAVGGLVGYLSGNTNIWDSWSSVPIVAPSEGGQVQNVGTTTTHYFGGIIGQTSTSWDGSVRESFSSSPVTLDLTAGSGNIFVGGLFGYIAPFHEPGFEIRDSYSISALRVNNNGTFSGWNQRGGLIGNTANTTPTFLDDRLINSFFNGSLTPAPSSSRVSGLNGRFSGASHPNSYANSDVASPSLLDVDPFRTQNSFTDWDFDTVWTMGDDHPVLRWAALDTTPPTLSSTTPVADATGVTVSDSVVFTFNESIAKGTGDLRVYSDATCSTLDQTIDVTSARVTVSGSTATVSFAAPNQLTYGEMTCIEIDSGAITDTAGNAYAGLTKPNGVNFTTESTVPEAPTINGITAGNSQLTVAFTAGSDGGATITDYEYSTTGINDADFVSAGVTSSPVTITGLTNGTEYTVRLRAVNSAGESGPSNARNATPVSTPAAPSLTTITAGNGQLTLAFTAGSDGGAAISNYKYSTNGSTYTALSPADATTPVTITGLSNGTTYSVTLKAVNSVGDSVASNSLSGTPVAPTPPASDPSPSPSPAPAPAPEPDPAPAPAPRPAAVPTPPAEPPVVSTPARPSTPPAPTPPPAADPAPEAPAGPGAVLLRAEDIFEGTIILGTGTEELIMPAFVLQDIATQLAPDGAPLEEGALVIESGSTMIAVLIIQLGDVRMSAADMGNAIQFTLNIPGFESSSMTVAVQKQALVWAFWIQMGLLGVSAAIAVTMVWLFVARNRRRKNDGGSSGQRMNMTPPPPPMRPGGALGI